MKYDIIAIGELLIDMTAKEVNRKKIYIPNPGGAPANFLTMAQNLGLATCFVGKVGDDYFGNFLKSTLLSKKISIEGLILDKVYPTTLAFVHLEKGDSSFSFYRNQTADVMLDKKDINYGIISDSKAVYFGSLAFIEDPLASAVDEYVKTAKSKSKLIFFDANYRPALWNNTKRARDIMLEKMLVSDILKLSEEELFFITKEESLEKAIENIKKVKLPLVFITRGSDSTIIIHKDKDLHVETYDVAVVDTTGAGDAFFGAIAYSLLSADKKISQFSEGDLIEMTEFANYVASISVQKYGGIPSFPTNNDLKDYKGRKVF